MNLGRTPKLPAAFGKRREAVKFRSFEDLESACSSDSEDAIPDVKSPSSETAEGIEGKPRSSLTHTESEKTLAGDANAPPSSVSHLHVIKVSFTMVKQPPLDLYSP
jgi:hypothetical protein